MMRVLIEIHHPTWVYQFRYIINELEHRGHTVIVIAIDKDKTLQLLDFFGIKYICIGYSTGRNIAEKILILFTKTIKILKLCIKLKPDIFVGRESPFIAISSFLLRKKQIVFEDTETLWLGLLLCRLFSYKIITPVSFMKNLGKKHLRFDTYKELFYLHPKYFKPDPDVLHELGFNAQSKFVLCRFVALRASHDFGVSGLSIEQKLRLIKKLEPHAKILLSSEDPLPDEFAPYALKISPEKIHHLLYYASLVISEGPTMASEAAVLGTHAIYLSTLQYGTIKEQSEKYGLVSTFFKSSKPFEDALQKALDLLDTNNLRDLGRQKRDKLIKDKQDINKFMLEIIEREAKNQSNSCSSNITTSSLS